MKAVWLDTDWRYFPTEVMDAAYGVSELDASSWGVLPQLSEYPRELIAETGTLNLRRSFDLEPMGDTCVRVYLNLTIAPKDTQVYVNGWHAGTFRAGEPFHADVTDYVSLEDNLVLVKITRRGELSGMGIEPIPCGEPHP
ncbi:MAG: hypothetical protein LCI00_34245 [Chloroflexi bacterium]|nr:hypothetical protein [Chloroflexota bacterium]MCC6891919.1 hypothetical protein [Anaerolineae bacterium]